MAGSGTGVRQQQAERTRAAILRAARSRFAAVGYERATIRGIAADAGIDASMVMRYYGSKEGLFAAAADFDLALPNLVGVRREELGAAAVRHFLSRWEGASGAASREVDADDSLRVLLASATTTPAAAARMQEIFRLQLQPIVMAAGPYALDQAVTRAGLIASQMLGIALCRYVLRLPPVAALDTATLVRWLGPTIQRYLTEPAP